MSISTNLKRLLDDRSWSAEQLAVAMQRMSTPVSVQSINRWLAGKGNPKGDTIVALAKALNCTTDEILCGHELRAAS
jgi:transcriptional regulator with XRE-family HTH domain